MSRCRYRRRLGPCLGRRRQPDVRTPKTLQHSFKLAVLTASRSPALAPDLEISRSLPSVVFSSMRSDTSAARRQPHHPPGSATVPCSPPSLPLPWLQPRRRRVRRHPRTPPPRASPPPRSPIGSTTIAPLPRGRTSRAGGRSETTSTRATTLVSEGGHHHETHPPTPKLPPPAPPPSTNQPTNQPTHHQPTLLSTITLLRYLVNSLTHPATGQRRGCYPLL